MTEEYPKATILKLILIILIIFLSGMLAGKIIFQEKQPTDCHDYTLNQIKAGDATVECTNQFLEENEK